MVQSVEARSEERHPQHDTLNSWRVLLLITFAYSLSYIDRQLLNLLVDPIRGSLALNDTEFSLIQGAAFVTAYLIAAPIFGRLVDVTSRRNVLIFGVSAWSICTALCGFANSFPEMFLARFGVGFAEACIFPVAMSVIGDSFSPARMPRAMSIYTLGSGLGGGFSLLAGGAVLAFSGELRTLFPILESFQAWQMAFIVVGLPGIFYALFLFTMGEPERTRAGVSDVTVRPPTLREVSAMLGRRANFYARIYASIGMIAIVQLGFAAWLPSFMIRAHGLDAAHAGYVLGALGISFGSVGTLIGPWLSQWLARRGHVDAPLRTAAFAAIGMLMFCAALPLSPTADGALIAITGVYFFSGVPLGVIAGATQNATPSRMRGVVGSLYTFAAQFVGYMIGPTIIALITDQVFKDPTKVGYSLQIATSCASLLASLLLFSVLRHYREMLADLASTAQQEAKGS